MPHRSRLNVALLCSTALSALLSGPGLRAELRATEVPLDIVIVDELARRPEIALLFSAPLKAARASAATASLTVYAVATDRDDSRKRALLNYTYSGGVWTPAWQQALDADVNLLQLIDDSATQGATRLLGYSRGVLIELEKKTRNFVPKLEIPSMYRSDVAELTADVELARDLTGDDRVDLLVPDFDGWRFAAQREDGSFAAAQCFGPAPVMGMGSKRYVYFTAFEPYQFDYNRDGLTDIGFWKDDALRVHPQSVDGGFAAEPLVFAPDIDIESDAFFSLTVGEDEDNPTGRQAVLDTIEDLNGDSLPDLLVYSVTGEGLFGKETSYEIYLGVVGKAGTLEFETAPSSSVGSGGIQIDVERQDLDGDGQLEMIVTSFDLGLGSIIRGLLSRSANLDLSIYRLEDDRYPSTPNVKRRITAKLDLAKGEVFVPAVLAADVDGDGLKDLLVQDGDDTLRVYAGTGTSELFDKSSATIKLALPVSGGKVDAADVDADGDDDLLVQFAEDPEAGRPARLVAVIFDGEF